MDKDNFYSQFARKSPGYKLAVLGMTVVFGLLFYWWFFLSPLEDERDQLNARKARLVKTQAELDAKLAKKRELLKKQEELKALIAANEKALPTSAELPTLFKHLQRKAGDAGVNIQRWDYKKEEAVDVYIKVPVEIELTGTFHNIMRYFALLGPEGTFAEPVPLAPTRPLGDITAPAAALTSDDDSTIKQRIVSIENLELGGAKVKDGSVVLTAKFIASTFRQQESEDDKDDKAKAKAAKAEAAKAKAAKADGGAKGAAGKPGASSAGSTKPAPGGPK